MTCTCVNHTPVNKNGLQSLGERERERERENKQSTKWDEMKMRWAEQVSNRISRLGISQRSVPDTDSKMVSPQKPSSQAAFQVGLPRPPTKSSASVFCFHKLPTPLPPLCPTCLVQMHLANLLWAQPSNLRFYRGVSSMTHPPATLLCALWQDSTWCFFGERRISVRVEGSAGKCYFPLSQACLPQKNLSFLFDYCYEFCADPQREGNWANAAVLLNLTDTDTSLCSRAEC